jgi:hypothetical protein
VFDPKFATARSGRPSRLKSATAIAVGVDCTRTSSGPPLNPPLPLPRRIETLLLPWLTIARSCLLSSLKSAVARAIGVEFAPTVPKDEKPPAPPVNMETRPVLALATARSRKASALKCASATARGELNPVSVVSGSKPGANVGAFGEDGAVEPFRTWTSLKLVLATTTSRTPSLLTSPVATARGSAARKGRAAGPNDSAGHPDPDEFTRIATVRASLFAAATSGRP